MDDIYIYIHVILIIFYNKHVNDKEMFLNKILSIHDISKRNCKESNLGLSTHFSYV